MSNENDDPMIDFIDRYGVHCRMPQSELDAHERRTHEMHPHRLLQRIERLETGFANLLAQIERAVERD